MAYEAVVIVGVVSPCQGTAPVADLSGTEIHLSAGGHPVIFECDRMASDGSSVSFDIDGRSSLFTVSFMERMQI